MKRATLKTERGNTYLPNSYQKPNAFVDVLLPLLPPAANILLDIACRKILGWEDHRATRRDRISISQFMAATGFSRQTVITALDILEQARILIPVGKPNGQGQEYELNLADQYPYDFDYLNRLDRRSGNPNPDQTGIIARRLQIPIPDMAGSTGLNFRPVQNLDRSNQFNQAGELIRPVVVNSLDTQKQKTINVYMNDISPDDVIPGLNLSPNQVWNAALYNLHLEMTHASFDTWLPNTYIASIERPDPEHGEHPEPVEGPPIYHISVPNQYARDWLANRLTATVERTLKTILGHTITVLFVVTATAIAPPVVAPPVTGTLVIDQDESTVRV